ncbi:MAG: hypothetical protein LBJ71_01530, partial [Holosporaceae bacterium]|nr:hypothetical protein [Holosporaceae bacterium]
NDRNALAACDAVLNRMRAGDYSHLLKILCHFVTLVDCFDNLYDSSKKTNSGQLYASVVENMENGHLVCYQGFRNRLLIAIILFLKTATLL